jgi:hypothetical protein
MDVVCGESRSVAGEWCAAVVWVAGCLDLDGTRATVEGAAVAAGDVASGTNRGLVVAEVLVGAGDDDPATGRRITGAVGVDVCEVDGFTSACGAGSGDG